ncbi:MAG: sugar ABC transporter permease [Clostridia bacterium]|nr:sugar ABC transporter permease [Clostridia bacterium]
MNKNKEKNFWFRLKKDFGKNGSLYLLMIPVLAYFVLFCYLPMYGIIISFKDYSPRLGVFGSEWVGFKHFIEFINSPSFLPLIINTLRISIVTLCIGFPAPIILALLLNEVKSVKLGKVIQNCTYVPHFISLVVVCSIIRMFTADTGIIGSFYNAITGNTGNMLNDASTFIPIYALSNIWQECGWGAIIYLAALTGIDQSLYEAAEIDGAGKWRKVINITIPSILPTIIIMLIMRMGRMMNVGYEKILLLENSMTKEVSDVLSIYNYRRGLVLQQWSYSSAVGLFNTTINLLMVFMANRISRKVNNTSLW